MAAPWSSPGSRTGRRSPSATTWSSAVSACKASSLVDSRIDVGAIRLIEREPAVFELFATRSYPLEQAEEAIARLAGRDGEPPALHVALRPWMNREEQR